MSEPQWSETYLTPAEAARRLLVSPITLRRWAREGVLPSKRTPGGHRRFGERDVEQLVRRGGGGSGDRTALRVLVADDDAAFGRLLLEQVSSLAGVARVEWAADGFDAGAKVSTFQPDVLLLDLCMPGIDGFEVCRRLRAAPRTRHIRIVAMTGLAPEAAEERALSAGADACLFKPFELRALVDAIQPVQRSAELRS